MPKYDKYDPYDGGFRAPLAAAIADADKFTLYAVGLDSAGRVVLGGGQTGIVGALVAHEAKAAGDIVDVMTDGEIVDLDPAVFNAGTTYYGVTADGTVGTTAAGNTKIGFTVEETRLIVRAQP